MAVIVEDGTGLSGADVYASVAEATTYLDNLAGPTNAFSAAATTEEKERALRNGANYLNRKFGPRWKGKRINSTMALDWPRLGVSDRDGYAVDTAAVPAAVKSANAEMALRYLEDTTGHGTSRLDPDIDNPGNIKREKLRADVVELDTEWVAGASAEKHYSTVSRLVASLVQPAGRVTLA